MVYSAAKKEKKKVVVVEGRGVGGRCTMNGWDFIPSIGS